MRLNMPALPCRDANERCLATDEPEHRSSRIAVEGETATLARVELCNSIADRPANGRSAQLDAARHAGNEAVRQRREAEAP